jgi:Mg2+ and Co2+ transporter CorA
MIIRLSQDYHDYFQDYQITIRIITIKINIYGKIINIIINILVFITRMAMKIIIHNLTIITRIVKNDFSLR